MKIAAIYARRSKIVDTGDSIENQISLCKNYLKNIGITNIKVYSDEGFSGKNTDRPEFIKLMKDAKEKKFDILICYKLDRLSRNIGDFSNLINDLEKYNISFISVVEQFDTTSAMGKAMMYICSVFSQLERETTSQRVSDNMYSLASNGYWLGGECPLGFTNERKSFIDKNGTTRSYSQLTPIKEEISLVKLIFTKYWELKSLSQVEKYMLQNNIKTRHNKDWSKTTIKNILINPVYVKSDISVFNYLKSIGANVYGNADSIHGILIYKKRKGKNGKLRSPSEWIYAVSNHKGIIDSSTWLKTQEMINVNKIKSPNKRCSNTALLSGLIRCSKCGSPMRVCYGVKGKNSESRKHYYMCRLKHNSGKVRCSNKNVDGPEIDALIMSKLKELTINKKYLLNSLKEYKRSLNNSCENFLYNDIQHRLQININQINTLTSNIALTSDKEVIEILFNKLSALKKENSQLKARLNSINKENVNSTSFINSDELVEIMKNFSLFIDKIDVEAKRKLLASFVDKILVNGDTGAVKLIFKPLSQNSDTSICSKNEHTRIP